MKSRVALPLGGTLALALACASTLVCAQDPLPSWNDGHAKQRIVAFVTAVSNPAGKDFVPPADRIAVFDNDGTLWSEQPVYVQLTFALDRIKALAPQHPEWKQQQPFRGVLEGDLKSAAASGEKGLLQMMVATHAGMTSDEFARTVEAWLATARHPRFERPYTELVYQPMLELLAYLRRAGFKTYIVSGGGVEFMRVFAEQRYGVPSEQVIGSTIRTRYEVRNGTPTIVRLPEVDFVDDGAGKPAGIQKLIGRRPIAAFGNSDGDFEMLEWVTAAPGPRLGLIVHHEDAAREYAYDRGSPIGRLQRGLDEGPRRGWTIVNMKTDWKRIFPFEP
jgi:phosphoserine phosphatase